MKKTGTYLISKTGYLDSVRHLGLTTTDAVCELLDNSIDAKSTVVYIHVFQDEHGTSIVIEDNGKGIPADKIDEVLSFGGRIDNGKGSIGRFGWGLSASACTQTKRTEVYSKVKGGGWAMSYIDLEELKGLPEPIIPLAKPAVPPAHLRLKLKDPEQSTIIYLKNCDKLQPKKVDTIVKHLASEIGETHRKYLQHRKVFVNDIELQPVDPMMLMPSARFVDKLPGAAIEHKVISIAREEVDHETGKPAQVKIRIIRLDRRLMSKQATKKSGVKLPSNVVMNSDNQGFYIIREHRQIGRAETLRLYTKNPALNNLRIEISFPPVLDHLFGVQTNKNRFSMDEDLQNKIRTQLDTELAAFYALYKEWQAEQKRAKEEARLARESEDIAARANDRMKPDDYTPTPEELARARQERENQKAREMQKVDEDKDLTPTEKEQIKKEIENNFQFVRPFKLVFESVESGLFYRIRPLGDHTEVAINTQHPFYTKVYERASVQGFDTYLDLLLFALAKAEMSYYGKENVQRFYRDQRREWSANLEAFLDEAHQVEIEEGAEAFPDTQEDVEEEGARPVPRGKRARPAE